MLWTVDGHFHRAVGSLAVHSMWEGEISWQAQKHVVHVWCRNNKHQDKNEFINYLWLQQHQQAYDPCSYDVTQPTGKRKQKKKLKKKLRF